MFEKDTLIFMQKDLCDQWNRISWKGTVKEEDLAQSKDNSNKAMVHSFDVFILTMKKAIILSKCGR